LEAIEMRELLAPALRCALVLWLLCGIAYPLAATALARVFPFQAGGSLLRAPDGTVLGSSMIGQYWTTPRWFHGRPSATGSTPYDAGASGGSNFGPTSDALIRRLLADRKALETSQPELVGISLPADMLTTSASGLDPEISVANAMLQTARVARARGAPETAIRTLVARRVIERSLGVFGERRVNVLELNLALQRSFGNR